MAETRVERIYRSDGSLAGGDSERQVISRCEISLSSYLPDFWKVNVAI